VPSSGNTALPPTMPDTSSAWCGGPGVGVFQIVGAEPRTNLLPRPENAPGSWPMCSALDHQTCSTANLNAATFATLTFTQQKNGVRNERINHGCSGHLSLCPVTALASRILALHAHGATAATTLNALRATATAPFRYISPADITTRISATASSGLDGKALLVGRHHHQT
jgi:hypothetical protein